MFVSSSGFAVATAVRGDFEAGETEGEDEAEGEDGDEVEADVAGAPIDCVGIDGAAIDSVGAGCIGIDWVGSVGFCG